nr:MAG TPA: hypothetical protein [Bacteriophage sp.]
MAKRILKAQLRPCNCTLCDSKDMIQTKEGLALTPSRVKELTDRGIAVSLPNLNNFLQPESGSSWFVEPMFKRDANMCDIWEKEQLAKQRVVSAHKNDKKKFDL